jgi:catechol 2,3-dioxygenase-like lactoylglutathione lyase family enzyme
MANYAAFISHASQDRRAAERIEAALGRTRVWFDRSDIRLGALLGQELLSNIRSSRTLVLVWSAHAQQSPWVQTEWLAAANLGKPVIPVVLDSTPLPQALTNTLWVSLRRGSKAAMAELVRSVVDRRRRDSSVSHSMRLPDAARDAAIDRLAREQDAMFSTWSKDGLAAARAAQRRLERPTATLLRRYPLDSRVAALWAYHAKNGVLLDHDAEIAAGIRVTDQRLNEARWRFLRALWLDPRSAESLNGLGTIAWFDHDLDTAEFFVRAALAQEPAYPAAAHDLRLILQLRQRALAGRRSTATGTEPAAERSVPILPADDLAAARAFYVDALGFEVTFDTSNGGRSTGLLGLKRGGLELTIDSPMEGHGREVCASLRVGDADAVYAAWSTRTKVRRRPRNEAWGMRTFDLVDPSGNTLFVMGPIPPKRG